MQRTRTRMGISALVIGPTIALGLLALASGAGAQTGSTSSGSSGAGAGAAGQSSPSAPSTSSTLQSPAQPPPGGAASSANSKQAPSGTRAPSGTTNAPAPDAGTQQTPPSTTTRPGTNTPMPRATTAPPPPRDSKAIDAKRRDATRNRTSAGQDARIDFGAQFRRGENGLIVGTLREDGFLHNAGILEGDQIVSINGQNVTTEDEFRRFVAAGHGRVPVIVMRNDQRREIMVNLDELQGQGHGQASQAQQGQRAALGIWFYQYREGAHVVHVMEGSPAERAGIRAGDFVVQVNGSPINAWEALVQEIGQAEPKSTADLQVSRNDQPMQIRARLAGYDEVFAKGED